MDAGIKPIFYVSEYNQYWQDVLLGNEKLLAFHPDIIYIHTSSRNILEWPSVEDNVDTVNKLIHYKIMHYHQLWGKISEEYQCVIIQNNPVLMFHSNWSENLADKTMYFSRGTIDFRKTMGYLPDDNIVPQKEMNGREFEQLEIQEEALEVLDRMVEYCLDHETEVILFCAPNSIPYNYYDALEKYAEKKGITYINFYEIVDQTGISFATDFYDEGHLNCYGSAKLANYLADYIVKQGYDLTDFRSVEGKMWQRALDER